jgi:hypothetical protein
MKSIEDQVAVLSSLREEMEALEAELLGQIEALCGKLGQDDPRNGFYHPSLEGPVTIQSGRIYFRYRMQGNLGDSDTVGMLSLPVALFSSDEDLEKYLKFKAGIRAENIKLQWERDTAEFNRLKAKLAQ